MYRITYADAAGRFAATQLPAGTYRVCAFPVQVNQLGSCEWYGYGPDAGPQSVNLQAGQPVTDIRLILRTGTLIKIHVQDPGQWLARGYGFQAEIFSESGYVMVAQAMPGEPDIVYRVTVPRNYSFKIHVGAGPGLIVLNEAGESIQLNTPVLPVVSGPDIVDVRLTVTSPIVNAASFLPGLPLDGIASIFASGITNVKGIVAASTYPLPTELGGTSVKVGALPASLLSVANITGQEQINFQVPAWPTWYAATIEVNNNGVKRVFYGLTVGSGGPGIFLSAHGEPVVTHGNSANMVSASSPASKGEVIVIYATGLGCATPTPAFGMPTPTAPLSDCRNLATVQIAGSNARVLFAGLTPGFVGLYQLNVEVPPTAPPGSLDLQVFANSRRSNIVKLAVQ